MHRLRQLAILALAAVLGFGAAIAPTPAASPARAQTIVGQRHIVPGSVNRTSLAIGARYDARIRIGWESRNVKVHSIATIVNLSGDGRL